MKPVLTTHRVEQSQGVRAYLEVRKGRRYFDGIGDSKLDNFIIVISSVRPKRNTGFAIDLRIISIILTHT